MQEMASKRSQLAEERVVMEQDIVGLQQDLALADANYTQKTSLEALSVWVEKLPDYADDSSEAKEAVETLQTALQQLQTLLATRAATRAAEAAAKKAEEAEAETEERKGAEDPGEGTEKKRRRTADDEKKAADDEDWEDPMGFGNTMAVDTAGDPEEEPKTSKETAVEQLAAYEKQYAELCQVVSADVADEFMQWRRIGKKGRPGPYGQSSSAGPSSG